MDVQIVKQPELRVAAVRHVGQYMRISEAFAKLGQVAGKAGLFRPDALMIALYHDDPKMTPEPKLRSDAGVTIPATASVPPGLTEEKVPAGRYARTTHIGPYAKLPDVWNELTSKWLPSSGQKRGAGASYEVYRNDPTKTEPSKLITEIYIPLG